MTGHPRPYRVFQDSLGYRVETLPHKTSRGPEGLSQMRGGDGKEREGVTQAGSLSGILLGLLGPGP